MKIGKDPVGMIVKPGAERKVLELRFLRNCQVMGFEISDDLSLNRKPLINVLCTALGRSRALLIEDEKWSSFGEGLPTWSRLISIPEEDSLWKGASGWWGEEWFNERIYWLLSDLKSGAMACSALTRGERNPLNRTLNLVNLELLSLARIFGSKEDPQGFLYQWALEHGKGVR